MFESLLFFKKRTNFREMNFSYSALTCLAIQIAATFNNLFNVGIIEILVVVGLTILYLSMGYCIQI